MVAILGNGIYSVGEASRLLGVSSRRVHNLFMGWSSGRGLLASHDYPNDDARNRSLSFLDLIDSAIAIRLRANHVSPHRIRKLRQILEARWGTGHPFSHKNLYVDPSGRRFFSHSPNDDGDDELLEILPNQLAMPEILLPILKRVSYDPASKLAESIMCSDEYKVLINPRRRYGKPIVETSGMPTAILSECYEANGRDADFVADWYSVSAEEVLDAVRFESEFSGIAA